MNLFERIIRIIAIITNLSCRTIMVVIKSFFIKTNNSYYFVEMKKWANELLNITATKIIISGQENLKEGESYIYIANHTGLIDIPVLVNSINDNIHFMYRFSLQKIPMLGFALKHSPFIPIVREKGSSAMEGIEKASNILKKCGSVVLFPEGTRTKTGEIGKFKRGAFLISERTGKKIVPITIAGVEKITPIGNSWRLNKGKILVHINRPIDVIPTDRNEQNKIIDNTRNLIIQQKIALNNKEK